MIDTRSITFKMSMLLLAVSLIFIFSIVFISHSLFAVEYEKMEREKLELLMKNSEASIALNVSYGFEQAVDEIAKGLVDNPQLLHVQLDIDEGNKSLYYGKNIKELENVKSFSHQIILKDPLTFAKIGLFKGVYSREHFKYLMQKFYFWLSVAVGLFSLVSATSIIYLVKALRPLRDLGEEMGHFDLENPKPLRLEIGGFNEVASIANVANTMLSSIVQHMSKMNQLNKQLKQNEHHLDEAQHMAHVGSWEYRVDTQSFSMSKEMYRILHLHTHTEVQWDDFLNYICSEDRVHVDKQISEAIEVGSHCELNYKVYSASGAEVNIRTHLKVRKKSNITRLAAVSMDITQQHKTQKIIEKMAYFDSLTGLCNRSLFKDRLAKAMQVAKRDNHQLAVLFLDLDHFKMVNDTLGHDVGDELLCYIARTLGEQLRQADTLARIGGDEFMVLLPKVDDEKGAFKVAHKLLQSLQGQHLIGSHLLYITTSIGVAMYPSHADSVEEIIKYADIAMYKAKEDGRNRCSIYDKSMSSKVLYLMDIEQDLRVAIKNMEQFELYYQAKVCQIDNKVCGAEALIRWNHPSKGLIFPDSFIPLAESTGMIVEIGEWVMHECARQLVRWEEENLECISIALNLSSRQFQNSDLISTLSEVIAHYKINPKALELEITETISMSNIEGSLRTMHDFKDLGVSIAIDDFGTGYSSLAYLKQFPVDVLKIDKSFVMDMVDDEDDRAIVKTIISMAHTLNYKTVAEGVESVEHLELLKEMGCDSVQGYYYSKPIPVKEFDTFRREFNSQTIST